jgi:hypothetical protein
MVAIEALEAAHRARGDSAMNVAPLVRTQLRHQFVVQEGGLEGQISDPLSLACRQVSSSLAVVFPFCPVNSIALAKRISLQWWYPGYMIMTYLISIFAGTNILKKPALSIIASCMAVFGAFVELSRYDRSLVKYLLQRFETLVFLFSTCSVSLWTIVLHLWLDGVDIYMICNILNYLLFYSLSLLMDAAPGYKLWIRKVWVSLASINLLVQLVLLVLRDKKNWDLELCVNSDLCISPVEFIFYR